MPKKVRPRLLSSHLTLKIFVSHMLAVCTAALQNMCYIYLDNKGTHYIFKMYSIICVLFPPQNPVYFPILYFFFGSYNIHVSREGWAKI